MRRIFSFLTLFLFLHHCSWSQTYNWAKSFPMNDPNSYLEPNALEVDASGNVYSCGEFSGGVDFDPGPGTTLLTGNMNSQDVFIKKQDASGNLVWAKSFSGPNAFPSGSVIAVDNNANVYVAGNFDDQMDFDPGPGTSYYTPGGFLASYIVKLNSAGQLVWAKFLDGSSTCSATTITVDNNNNLYIGGSYDGQEDFDPGSGTQYSISTSGSESFLLKLDANGNYLWHRVLAGSSYSQAMSIATNNSKVYMTGYYSGGPVDFDPGPASQVATSNAFSSDAYVVTLNDQGNYVQHLVFGGSLDETPQSIKVDASGNIYLAGNFIGTCDFDPGTPIVNLTSTAGTYDPFVMKINANGNLAWAGLFEGPDDEQLMDMDIDGVGNMYTTGYFSTSIDLDPGNGTTSYTTNGVEDIFYTKINTTGVLVNSGHMGSVYPDGGFSIRVRNYSIYAEGLYSGTVDFDPSPANNTLTSAFPGINDLYTYRWDQCTPTTATLNVTATNCSYTLNGQVYTGNGTYTQVIPNSSGCDSIITINLSGATTNTHLYPVVCGVSSYTYNGQTYTASGVYTQYHTNSNGCDSNTILHLSMGMPDTTIQNESACDFFFFNNQWLFNSGTYTQTLTNSNGCDSTIILNLTINLSSYATLTVPSCGPYTFNGQVYTTSGIYTNSFSSSTGCDSVIDLDLTVYNVNVGVNQSSATLTAQASAPATYQWLTCNPYSVISGATSATYTATTNGQYAVAVTENGCTDTSSCYTVSGLGVNDISLYDHVRVWPNPVSDVLHIQTSQALDPMHCRVLNIAGQVLIQADADRKKSMDVSVKSLSAGIYFLHVNNGKEEAIFRFVKE